MSIILLKRINIIYTRETGLGPSAHLFVCFPYCFSWTQWLQFTASPANVVDLDGDGLNEVRTALLLTYSLKVVAVPNAEMDIPYDTKAYTLFVLSGAFGSGNDSAMRKTGWETLPQGVLSNALF